MSGKEPAEEPKAGPSMPQDDDLLKAFFSEMRDVDRDNEVLRILSAFKLNPYDQLGLPYTATPEDIKRQYRKVSLIVHPDKCHHPQAKAAFDVLRTAQETLLDEDKCAETKEILRMAKEEVLKERKKSARKDVTVEVASLIHAEGREGVEREWEESDEFHSLWRDRAKDFLAKAEWRRRQLDRRIKEEEERAKKEKEEEKEREAKRRKLDESVKGTRDQRISSWRSFANTGKPKAEGVEGKKIPTGGLRPPKIKTEDADRSYVQRAVQKEDAW